VKPKHLQSLSLINVADWSDFGKNVGNVGFVEGSEAEAFLAEILQRRADQIKFLVVDNEETVVECCTRLD
jgi:hypothetical protein